MTARIIKVIIGNRSVVNGIKEKSLDMYHHFGTSFKLRFTSGIKYIIILTAIISIR
jgi:hypothetical protein